MNNDETKSTMNRVTPDDGRAGGRYWPTFKKVLNPQTGDIEYVSTQPEYQSEQIVQASAVSAE
jgi:hypothetical protein